MVARLAEELGAAPIKGKVWTHKLDDHWLIKINGCHEKKDSIPPYCMFVEFNGFPAGCLSPFEGSFADGTAANEDEFIDAVIAKLEGLGVDVSDIKEDDMRENGPAPGRKKILSQKEAEGQILDFINELED